MIAVPVRLVFLLGLVGVFEGAAVAQFGQMVPQPAPLPPPESVDVRVGSWLESSVRYSPLRLITNEMSSDSRGDDHQGMTARDAEKPQRVPHSYVRVRTAIVHPQPSLSRATPRYEVTVPSFDDADWRVVAALGKPLPAEGMTCDQMSLRALATWLQGKLHCAVRLDPKSLEGFDVDAPCLTGTWTGTDYRHAVRELLAGCGLAFGIRNGGIVLMTRDAVDESMRVAVYPLPTDCDPMKLVDHITAVVQPATWDSQGGPATIRFAVDANAMLVSQTEDIHEELKNLLSKGFDQDLQPSAGDPSQPSPKAIRVHPIRDPKTLRELEASLVGLCNATLGQDADPSAKVMAIGGKLVVQSSSRPFQVYAAEVVRAIEGIEVVTREVIVTERDEGNPGKVPTSGGAANQGGGFCWVAREVYGADPRWLLFRDWMLTEAPCWLRTSYAAQGRAFAEWLRTRPVAKSCIRAAMDQAIAGI